MVNISDFQSGNEGSIPSICSNNKIMEENEFRIFKDGDGLASTCTWGYYAPSRMPQETNLGINTLTKEAKKDYE